MSSLGRSMSYCARRVWAARARLLTVARVRICRVEASIGVPPGPRPNKVDSEAPIAASCACIQSSNWSAVASVWASISDALYDWKSELTLEMLESIFLPSLSNCCPNSESSRLRPARVAMPKLSMSPAPVSKLCFAAPVKTSNTRMRFSKFRLMDAILSFCWALETASSALASACSAAYSAAIFPTICATLDLPSTTRLYTFVAFWLATLFEALTCAS